MRKTALFILTAFAAGFAAQAEVKVTFDFSDTASLNPSVNEPGLKQEVALDGRTFTEGDVEVGFTAAVDGNTHVRLYHSYDAGVDLRLYDGDAMTVTTTNPAYHIKEISFTMSLSGAATGSADINLIPSTGNFDWAAETWTTDAGGSVQSVILTSAEQSRISAMTVILDEISRITDVEDAGSSRTPVYYYTILGKRIAASSLVPGVYIRVVGDKATKIIVR